MRKFNIRALVSVTTGRLLCPFDEMQGLIRYIVGRDVYSHQIGYKLFMDEVRLAVLAQHPQLADIDAASIDLDNWETVGDSCASKYGASLALKPMGDSKCRDDAMTIPLKGKHVIEVVA